MSRMVIDNALCDHCGACVKSCPFSAIELSNDGVAFNAACRICKICIKSCPSHAIKFEETAKTSVDKALWNGILVYVEHTHGDIHPVTFELIGKARELALKLSQPVSCIFIGSHVVEKARELLDYGVDTVYVYDNEELMHFRSDIYADVLEDIVADLKPAIVLVGGTCVGRSLAPRLSTRFRTGLTADCTFLDVRQNSDLIQVRPAFGGNIMAQIITPDARPQFATVRYKVMEKARKTAEAAGVVAVRELPRGIQSKIRIIRVIKKEKLPSISDAEIIVAGGRGLKNRNDLRMLEDLAEVLDGQTAVTRPLVENGWASYTKQIGLSGRTVKPQLIITCGISGAIQFSACMRNSDCIIAINKDRNAPIFNMAHYGIVGDLYDILPMLMEKMKRGEPIL